MDHLHPISKKLSIQAHYEHRMQSRRPAGSDGCLRQMARERVREICASSMIWWWWWWCIYIYIYVCVCVYVYFNSFSHTHTHTHTYIYIYMCVIYESSIPPSQVLPLPHYISLSFPTEIKSKPTTPTNSPSMIYFSLFSFISFVLRPYPTLSDRSLLSCLKVTQCSTSEIGDAPLYNPCSQAIQVMTTGPLPAP